MASGRRQYPFHLIEPKWQRSWDEQETFRAWNPGEAVPSKHPFARRHPNAKPGELPKFYILDMFPYPSGAGLHVGHPEGYTATDILARYRRALGYNVLHPMGWDAFGLPAEQYAIKTGQHPRKTTEANIATFKRQIKSLGFSYDWSREVDTTDPKYFKWTQWIFLGSTNSWFNPATQQSGGRLRPCGEFPVAGRRLWEIRPTPKSETANGARIGISNASSPSLSIGSSGLVVRTQPGTVLVQSRKWWTAKAKWVVSPSCSASRCASGLSLRILAYAERLLRRS